MDKKTVNLNFPIDEAVHIKLKRAAAEKRVTIRVLAERILRQALKGE